MVPPPSLSFSHLFNPHTPGLYGDELEEDFAVSTLGNPSAITDSAADDGAAEFIEPPEDLSALGEAEAAQPIPTLDSRPPRMMMNADALPPKPNAASSGGSLVAASPLSYSAQVAEQFSSSYRQTPSQERGRLDAARLAQFNQATQNASAPPGSTGASAADGQARPVRPSEMKDEGCVFPPLLPPHASVRAVSCRRRVCCCTSRRKPKREVRGRLCAPRFFCTGSVNFTEKQCVGYLAVVSTRTECLLHLLATCVLPDVVASFDGISSLTLYPSFISYTVSCYSKMSKLTSVLRYVAMLCLRLRLSSALHLHLCRLPPFRYYPPRPYSKMFVGGLSWDTTDGTCFLSRFPHTLSLFCQMSCPFC